MMHQPGFQLATGLCQHDVLFAPVAKLLPALDQTIRNHAVDHYNGCVFSDICPIAELFLSQTVL